MTRPKISVRPEMSHVAKIPIVRSLDSKESQALHGRTACNLRRVRLLVDAGARRRPKIVPVVVHATSEASAMRKAMRLGVRFYGVRFLAAATPHSLWRA